MIFSKVANQNSYPFILPGLPYSANSLEPNLSAETFEYHYAKHHQAYVTNLNNLVKDTNLEKLNLEEIILDSFKNKNQKVFNNAAQVWNHTFYWYSMKNDGGIQNIEKNVSQKFLSAINDDFGNIKNFEDGFKNAANHFGSAWVWLVLDKSKKLQIRSTGNADLPITEGEIPIITCDIWEHAYYVDFRNRRADYVSVFLSKLINWEFAENNYLSNI